MSASVIRLRFSTGRARRLMSLLAVVLGVVTVSAVLPASANSAPSVPTDVVATLDGSTITVSWTASTDPDGSVEGYNIYLGGDYSTTVKGQTFYTEAIGDRTGTLEFQVTAFDAGSPQGFSPMSEVATLSLEPILGNTNPGLPEGDLAEGESVQRESAEPADGSSGPGLELPTATSGPRPIAPSQVVASRDGDQLNVEWNEGTVAQGQIAGYNIYRDGTYIDTVGPAIQKWSEPIGAGQGEVIYSVVVFDDSEPIKFSPNSAEAVIDLGNAPATEGEQTAVQGEAFPTADQDCTSGRTQSLIVAGDSWADRVGPFLNRTFSKRGWTVYEIGVGSTLSRDWLPGTANHQNLVGKLEINLSECQENVLSLSVGGNDLVLPEGGANAFPQSPEQSAERLARAAANIIAIIDSVRATDPKVRIILPGYDLLNPTVNAACLTAANVFVGEPDRPFDPATSNNRQQGIRNMYLSVANARPGVITPNLLGVTQGRPGNPDFTSLPPVIYSSSDCLHLTGGPSEPAVSGSSSSFDDLFGLNGYEIWGSELAMVIDPTLSLTYRLDLSPDAPPPELADPFGDPLLPEGGRPQDFVVFEAEDYTTRDTSGWGRGAAAGATGNPSINAVVALAGEDSSRGDSPRLTYEIPITTAGSYDLWIRRRATDATKDQLTWGFDGTQQSGEGLGGQLGSAFTWVYLGAAELQAGTRLLEIGRLEGQLVIDRLALMRPGIMPLGDGGPANLVPRRALTSGPVAGNSLTIDYNKLYVADAGEEGGLQDGDEPRLVVIEFRTTPGLANSTKVTNSFRYDGPKRLDDGDTWWITDNIGRFEYENFVAINQRDVRAGQLPELIGHVVILLEDEPFSSSPVRDKLQDVADELERAIVQIIEELDPVSIAADPQGLAEQIIVASGLVVDASKPYNNRGISDTLEDNFRDIGGADVVGFFPMFFLSVDESLAPSIDAAFAEQLQGVSAAGGALRDRSFQIRKRGSGATYVVDVEVRVGN